MEPRDEFFSAKTLSRPAEELQQKLNFFMIDPHFLTGNTVEIFGGKLKFLLNGSIPKTLIFPKQKVDLNPTQAILFDANTNNTVTNTTVYMVVGVNGVMETRTNTSIITKSTSGIPAKLFIGNF
jgi:hypothetical protein